MRGRLLLALGACVFVVAAPSASGQIATAGAPATATYIVVFKPGAVASAGVPAAARGLTRAETGTLRFVYQHALKGFAVRASSAEAAALARDSRVAYVEPDQPVHAVGMERQPTWGLDRVDQRDLPLNKMYNYNQTGQGVNAYIIDTGILATHREFTGRVGIGADFVGDGNGTNDCNGHGTHVAGTTGGSAFGVAKQVTLHAVRVLNCGGSGLVSAAIAGVDWVTANHASPAVANMSLISGGSTAMDTAVANSIGSGVTYAVAAGNADADACKYSPARVPAAITVGATTNTDARAEYSDHGSCLDIFAPGSSIKSAWASSNRATMTLSGTSMAAPHVTGAAALYLQTNPDASAAMVTQALINNSTPNKVAGAGTGSPNRLLDSLLDTNLLRPPPIVGTATPFAPLPLQPLEAAR